MKKSKAWKIKTLIVIGIFCLLPGVLKVYASEVIFDADAVREKTATKSSLLDVNGIFVFRDEFIERERVVKQEYKERLEGIEMLVLSSPQQDFDYETWVDLVLAADTGKYIKDVYNEKEDNNLRWWIYCGTASICVLCLAVRIEDERKKKKEETKGEKIEDERYREV
ncbi:MAG: hypothetical protein NC314_04275 [Roseburia sp.]|nr:hypothetical protein [Roseburia sp.]MCM1242035.1 hypothetical protein [Roseburia sp.]